ncbi:MAG: WYL domain-containing protein [Gammaproteobacteria bacterium]|nr:WYL domain-containing protein [Gammaproteobacteria bacterium]
MERFDRFYALHGLLSTYRHPVSLKHIMDELECSRASVTRLITKMRLYLHAPIEYDRKANGYYYNQKQQGGHPYELPGLWFNTSELLALLTSQTLLERVDPGVYSQQLNPLRQRIEAILKNSGEDTAEISKRIRILSIANRHFNNHTFQHITSAVLQRKQLNISYRGRQNSEASSRTLSPQRLIYYRNNWYLDAWCHLRNEFRTFAVERIEHARSLKQKARHISEAELDNTFTAAFGIFSGKATHTAILHFTPERARWVAEEQWHPQQQSRWLENGSYELQLPYGNPTELIMDILKYGTDVEVIKPASLRNAVKSRIAGMMQLYA